MKIPHTAFRISHSRAAFAVLLLLACLPLASCGFHLRGTGKAELPAALSTLQVRVEGNLLENHPLLAAMKYALRTQANVRIEETGDVPRLLLYGERSDSRVLSVTSTGKAEEYLLTYEVSFRLTGTKEQSLSEPQTVKVQRDYHYDPLSVLAKEREEQELRRELQRDAVQQILRRLSRIALIDSDANKR
jgi:LPS-assembly lipoprotein